MGRTTHLELAAMGSRQLIQEWCRCLGGARVGSAGTTNSPEWSRGGRPGCDRGEGLKGTWSHSPCRAAGEGGGRSPCGAQISG